MASIVGRVYQGADPDHLMREIMVRLEQPGEAPGAWLDLSILRRSLGDVANAELFQREALSSTRLFRLPSVESKPLRLLAFKTAGNFMVNTPLEFMLEGGPVEVVSVYLNEDMTEIGFVPDHDVAILAIGESPESRDLLLKCKLWLANWPRPLLNFNVDTIMSLDRAKLWQALSGACGLQCPWTRDVELQDLMHDPDVKFLHGINGGSDDFPLILRPEGAHAGAGTFKVDSREGLMSALPNTTSERLNLSQFIDYSSNDGQFRKYRIALIDGVAYPAHMAISSKWMVHYLNAGMTESALKRDEESAWFNDFDNTFAMKHEIGFRSLCDRLKLDYFTIDCAETKNGDLLIFEIDTAMIVHCMDAAPEFSYKKAPMQRLFAAFRQMLARRV